MMKRKWMTLLCCAAVGLAVGTSQVLKGLAQTAGDDGTGIPAAAAVEAALAETADAEAGGLTPQAPEQGAVPAENPAAEQPAAPGAESVPESGAAETAEPAPEMLTPDETAPDEPAAPSAADAPAGAGSDPAVSPAPEEPAPTEPAETAAPAEPNGPNVGTEPAGSSEPNETPAVPSNPAVPVPSEPTVTAPARPDETAATAAPAAKTWAVTYVLRPGDAGTLPFDTAAVEKGRAIGAGRVPAPVLPDGIELAGYAVGDRVLTAAELAAYVPDRDLTVEVRTEKVKSRPAGDPVPASGTIAAEQRHLAGLLEERIRDVRSALKLSDAVEADMGTNHFAEVLAVYAAVSGQTDGFPYGVVIRDVTQLRHIYWSMTQVTGMSNHQTARIGVRRLSVAEAAGVLGLTAEQQARASELAASGAAAVRAWSEVGAQARPSEPAASGAGAAAAEGRSPQRMPDAGRP